MAETCKATIHEGARKGSTCMFPAQEDGYCGRHKRYKLYDDGITEGKKWCRFFFRGCNNEVVEGRLSCTECKTPVEPCQHDGCSYKKQKDNKYCGKHSRDSYRDEEKEKGITYCDIDRGCFNVCRKGYKTCESCLEKNAVTDSKKYQEKKGLHIKIREAGGSDQPLQICCKCGKDFPTFLTYANKISQLCKSCNEKQHILDDERCNRVRSYKVEKANNINSYIREYHNNAVKRGLEYSLTPEEFISLVEKPCHYCNYFKEGEVNGIDRVNNDKGYFKDNVVPCCELCNKIKTVFEVDLFLNICEKIATRTIFTKEDSINWPVHYSYKLLPRYSAYRLGAIGRNLTFELTLQEFNNIIDKPCYLCSYDGIVGIDRKDNKKNYTVENSNPCCFTCNRMKGDLEFDIFIEKIQAVHKHQMSLKSPLTTPALTSVITPVITTSKVWKARGLYKAILDKSDVGFLEINKAILPASEYTTLKESILKQTEEGALDTLKIFLSKLNKRRKRHIESDDSIQLV